LVPGHPRGIGGIGLLGYHLVGTGDSEILLRGRLSTGEKTVKLGGANDRENLRAPEWIVGFCQLFTERNG
jgi:hypothetical protein